MKKIKVIVSLLLALSILSVPIQASSILSEEEHVQVGKIVEVIDGEVLKVFFYRRNFVAPVIETVKVIGIDTEGSKPAFDYTTSKLLGRIAYFLYDNNHSNEVDDMSHAHVFLDYDTTLAEELLRSGNARLDTTYEGVKFYESYQKAESIARLYELGRWTLSDTVSKDKININTASLQQLMDVLNMTSVEASKVINYRNHNFFNSIDEIMAVDASFDHDWYIERSRNISVITNLNRASYKELASLLTHIEDSGEQLDDLQYFLNFNEVVDVEQIKTVTSLSNYVERILRFLTTESTANFIDYDLDRINVNTVSMSEFVSVTGLPRTSYEKLAALRQDGEYTIQSIGELYETNLVFPKLEAYKYVDKLQTHTHINEAGYTEVASLLSQLNISQTDKDIILYAIDLVWPIRSRRELSIILGQEVYNEISEFIIFDNSTIQEYYNPNTLLGLDDRDLNTKYKGKTSNFTNINKASKEMLLDLNPEMSVALVNDILEYRVEHSFYDNNDLRELFIRHDLLSLYNRISHFLTYY